MPFKRDLFTGKLVETDASAHGREIIFRGEAPFGESGRAAGAYNRPWVSEAMGLENADQYREFNEAMQRDGVTGAHYRPDGKLECATRGHAVGRSSGSDSSTATPATATTRADKRRGPFRMTSRCPLVTSLGYSFRFVATATPPLI